MSVTHTLRNISKINETLQMEKEQLYFSVYNAIDEKRHITDNVMYKDITMLLSCLNNMDPRNYEIEDIIEINKRFITSYTNWEVYCRIRKNYKLKIIILLEKIINLMNNEKIYDKEYRSNFYSISHYRGVFNKLLDEFSTGTIEFETANEFLNYLIKILCRANDNVKNLEKRLNE